jgi:drug/metabolite transporter (DMT)-like permease
MHARDTDTRGHLALVLGLLAVSASGPFFVMSQMSAYAAVLWRTLLGGLLALSVAWWRGSLQPTLLRRHARGVLLSGALLGPHFILWVKAFELTDYSSNLILLVAQPVFGAFLERAYGRALPKRAPLALTLSLVGMLLVAGGDVSLGPRALLGDVFCIAAGIIGALFFELGRSARQALALDAYMGATLLVASVTALPVAIGADVNLLDYPRPSWFWLSGIVLVCTLAGHGLLNAAARSVPLFVLNTALLLEPVLAIGLGALLFGAAITGTQLLGGALLFAAVATLLLSSAPQLPAAPAA